jgi:hypothetical protein
MSIDPLATTLADVRICAQRTAGVDIRLVYQTARFTRAGRRARPTLLDTSLRFEIDTMSELRTPQLSPRRLRRKGQLARRIQSGRSRDMTFSSATDERMIFSLRRLLRSFDELSVAKFRRRSLGSALEARSHFIEELERLV